MTSRRQILRHAAGAALLALAGACALHQSEFVATLEDGREGARVEIEYEGAEYISRIELSRKIADLMLDLSKQPDRDGPAFDAAQELQDFYLQQGFPNAKVDYELEREPTGAAPTRVHVRFVITEGPMVTVEEVTIGGNHSIPTDELMPLWSRRQSGALGLGDPLFVLADLEAFATAIRAIYQFRGYIEATVDGPQLTPSEDATRVRVTFRVQEGPIYSLRRVVVDRAILDALGTGAPPLPEAQPFSWSVIEEYILAVRRRLREDGYHDPRVLRPLIGQDSEKKLVDVAIRGEPGKRVHVGEVVVRGNEKTRTTIIRGKLALDPGDLFAGSREDAALRKLYETGLFRKVEILHEPIEGDEERIRLAIVVEEAKTAAVEVRVGYGTYEKVRGGIRLQEDNVFGTGRIASIEGKVHTKGYKTGAALTDPDFFETETIASLSGELFRREEPSYLDRAVGGTFSLQRPIFDEVTARTGYTYEHRAGARVDATDPTTIDPDYDKALIFLELGNDRRDSPIFPREGHHEVVSVDWADQVLGGEIDFVRLRMRATGYWPATEKLVLVARGDVGWIWPGGGVDTVPIQERFFNGGESTVRSFRESHLGPKDMNGRPIGGEYRNVLNLEARYTLVRPLEAAVFFDMGNVGRNVKDWGLSNLHYGLGAGLSYGLPIGPIRFDAAWNPDREPGDEVWVFHLTIGHPF